MRYQRPLSGPCNATGHFVTVRTDVAAVHCEHSIAAFPFHTYTGATTGHIACDISAIKYQIGFIFQSDSSTAILINMCTFATEILCLVVCHISTVHRNCRGLSTIEATAALGVRPSRVAENITARYSNVSTLRINGSAKAVGSLAIGGRRIEESGIFKNTCIS